MKFDKLSLFADGLSVPVTANTTTYSKVLDCRKCGQLGIDGALRVWGGVVGTANATGSVTTKLQTSGDLATWTDLVTETQNGGSLIGIALPCKGLKRFIRLAFVVGATPLGSAIAVKAGLVDKFDIEDLPSVQTYPPMEDLAVLGDKIAEPLELGNVTGTATTGTAATFTAPIAAGAVTGMECAEATISYTVSGAVLSIKTTSATAAATYTVAFVDGLGNKVTKTVTVGAGT